MENKEINALTNDYKSLINVDFPKYNPITKKTRENTTNYSLRVGSRGDMRTAMGMYKTDEEWEEYKEKVLNKKLP